MMPRVFHAHGSTEPNASGARKRPNQRSMRDLFSARFGWGLRTRSSSGNFCRIVSDDRGITQGRFRTNRTESIQKTPLISLAKFTLTGRQIETLRKCVFAVVLNSTSNGVHSLVPVRPRLDTWRHFEHSKSTI